MKKKRRAALLALLLLLLPACTGEKTPPLPALSPLPTLSPQPTLAPLPSTPPLPTASPIPDAAPTVPIWTSQHVEQEFTADDGTVVMTASYTCPVIENSADFAPWELINTYYQYHCADLLDTAEETAAWAMDDYNVSKSTNMEFKAYLEDLEYSLTYVTDRLVSVKRELYTNNGGAYPTVLRLSEQFNLDTGERLAFADFFEDPGPAVERIEAELQAQNAAAEQPVDAGALAASFQPEHFYLTEVGFVFWFQGDELGPMNSPLEFTISYDMLEDLSSEWISQ